MTTLPKSDGTFTKNLEETMELMMESFCPIDDESNDNEYQTGIRQETKRPLHTPDDKEFTKEEVERMIRREWYHSRNLQPSIQYPPQVRYRDIQRMPQNWVFSPKMEMG